MRYKMEVYIIVSTRVSALVNVIHQPGEGSGVESFSHGMSVRIYL